MMEKQQSDYRESEIGESNGTGAMTEKRILILYDVTKEAETSPINHHVITKCFS